jgi:hypothetical protein
LAQNLSKNKFDPFACSIVQTLMGTMTVELLWRCFRGIKQKAESLLTPLVAYG